MKGLLVTALAALLAVIALGYRAQDPTTPVHRPLDEIDKFF